VVGFALVQGDFLNENPLLGMLIMSRIRGFNAFLPKLYAQYTMCIGIEDHKVFLVECYFNTEKLNTTQSDYTYWF
jgi:hypothetical protein